MMKIGDRVNKLEDGNEIFKGVGDRASSGGKHKEMQSEMA